VNAQLILVGQKANAALEEMEADPKAITRAWQRFSQFRLRGSCSSPRRWQDQVLERRGCAGQHVSAQVVHRQSIPCGCRCCRYFHGHQAQVGYDTGPLLLGASICLCRVAEGRVSSSAPFEDEQVEEGCNVTHILLC